MVYAHSRPHAACKPAGFGWRLKTEANILQAPTCNRGGVATSSYSTKSPEQPARLLPPPRKEFSRGIEPEIPGKGDGNSEIVAWLEQRLQSSPAASPRLAKSNDRPKNPSKAGKHAHDPAKDLADIVAASSGHPASLLRSTNLDIKEVHRLLSNLARGGHDSKAMEVLEWVNDQPSYQETRGFLYTQMISWFGRSPSRRPTALHLYDRIREEVKAQTMTLDLIGYNTMISALGKAGCWRQTMEAFEDMQVAGVKPDVVTFSSLIKACQACGNRWKTAMGYLKRMSAEGVEPNVITYTTLISCCQRAGQWVRAMNVFWEMEEAGVAADLKAYNSVISACARGGRWENAWEVVGTMRRCRVQPNARTYNALISACERAGQPHRALEAFKNMQRDAAAAWAGAQIQPTLVTYNTLMNACAKGGLYYTVMELYEGMLQRELGPDVITLTVLITACKEQGFWEESLELVAKFSRDHSVRLNTIACNALIATVGRAGRWQYALQFFEQLARGELEGRPDAWTFAAIVLACRAGEQWLLVLQFYREMRTRRLPIYKDVYYAVLEACKHQGLWKEGSDVLQDMRADVAANRLDGRLSDLAAWQTVFAFPPLMEAVPKPIIDAALAAIDSGRLARRLVSKSQKKDNLDDEDSEE